LQLAKPTQARPSIDEGTERLGNDNDASLTTMMNLACNGVLSTLFGVKFLNQATQLLLLELARRHQRTGF
jgi:hypothetical protein